MKKKLIKIIAWVVPIALITFMVANFAVIRNVVALADADNDKQECYNRIYNNPLKMVFYCGTCSMVPGDNTALSGKSSCLPTVNPGIQQ